MPLTFLSCRRTLAQLEAYSNHELSPRQMTGVRFHLAICHACEEKFAAHTPFIEAMRETLPSVAALEETARREDFPRRANRPESDAKTHSTASGGV